MKLLSKRTRRRLRYYGSKWWLRKFRHPVSLLDLFALDVQPGKTHNGFLIRVYTEKHDTPAFHYFAAIVARSLDVIARHDPRRYQTIVRNIKIIAWFPHLDSLGMYNRLFRVCTVNYQGTFADHADAAREPSLYEVVYLASLLVHEATHGKIYSYFVPYDKQNREAIEKLCIKEEERFMNRLYHLGVFPKVTMRPFSAEKWKKYWED